MRPIEINPYWGAGVWRTARRAHACESGVCSVGIPAGARYFDVRRGLGLRVCETCVAAAEKKIVPPID